MFDTQRWRASAVWLPYNLLRAIQFNVLAVKLGAGAAVPLFGRLTISRRGLYRRGGVAPTRWRSIDVNVVHACMQFETASCSRFVVLELPHQLSAGFVLP